MFTPRQVSMGNKVYKLHIKHDTKKIVLTLPPDYSIQQLKENIFDEFKVKPDDQFLVCNGKPMEANNLMTLKQAKIPNGSKIICTKQTKQKQEETGLEDEPEKSDNMHDVLKKMLEEAESLESKVEKVEKERKRLLREPVPLFQGDPSANYKQLRKNCGVHGELLMRLLEQMDGLQMPEGETELRSQRKEVATKLNHVLDKNDQLIEKLADAIKWAT